MILPRSGRVFVSRDERVPAGRECKQDRNWSVQNNFGAFRILPCRRVTAAGRFLSTQHGGGLIPVQAGWLEATSGFHPVGAFFLCAFSHCLNVAAGTGQFGE